MASTSKLGYILIIDDDTTSNFLTKTILEDIGLSKRIYDFTDIHKALNFIQEKCASYSYYNQGSGRQQELSNIILLDLNMPVMNGFEFLDELHSLEGIQSQHLQIVMLSSSSYNRDIEKAKEYNIINFVTKPLTEEKLKEIIDQIPELY